MLHWSTVPKQKWWTCFTWIILSSLLGCHIRCENINGSALQYVGDTVLSVIPREAVPLNQPESLNPPSEDTKDSLSLQNHIVDHAAEPPRRGNKPTAQPVPRTRANPLAPSFLNETGQNVPTIRWDMDEDHQDSPRGNEDNPPKQLVPQEVNSVNTTSQGFQSEINGDHNTLVSRKKENQSIEEPDLIPFSPDTPIYDTGDFSGNGEIGITSEFIPITTPYDDDATSESETLNYTSDSVSHLQKSAPNDFESHSDNLPVVASTFSTVIVNMVQDNASLATNGNGSADNIVTSSVFQTRDSRVQTEELQSDGVISPSFVPPAEIQSSILVPFSKTDVSSSLISRQSRMKSWSISSVLDDAVMLNYSTSVTSLALNLSENFQSDLNSYFLDAPVLLSSVSPSDSILVSQMSAILNDSVVLNSIISGQNAPYLNDHFKEYFKDLNDSPNHLNISGISPTKSSVDKDVEHGGHLNSVLSWNNSLDVKDGFNAGRKSFTDPTKDPVTTSHSKIVEVHSSLYESLKQFVTDEQTEVILNNTDTQYLPIDSYAINEQFATFDILPTSQFLYTPASSIVVHSAFNNTSFELNMIPSTEASRSALENTTDPTTPKSRLPVISTKEPNWTQSDKVYVTNWKDKQAMIPVEVKPSHVLPTVKIPLAYLSMTLQCSWTYFCTQYDRLREFLAQQLSNELKYRIKDSQVMFFNTDACNHISQMDFNDTTKSHIMVPLYVVDQFGNYSKTLTEKLGHIFNKNGLKGFWDNINLHNVTLAVQLHTTPHSDIAQQSGAVENDMGIIAAVTISCIAGICLLLLCVLLAILKRRHGLMKQARKCRKVTDAYSLDSISIYSSFYKRRLRASKRSYLNQGFEDPQAPANKLTYSGMLKFCNNEEDVIEEYKKIPLTVAKLEDLPPGADIKNRYANIIPFPETRVQLSMKGEDPSSEYINANYIRGFLRDQRAYIACQAPLESTIVDFWEMVWENQSKVIIMLTVLQEDGVEKCVPYFAESAVIDSHRLFGDFQVTTKRIDAREVLTISFLQLKNLEKNLMREVVHFWYTAWPTQSVPGDSASIIDMLLEARPLMKANSGPSIVHCSPGTGRTGTVIAVDICMQEYESTRSIDVPQCVYRLRRDRGGLVQTSEQYLYIYKTLIDYASRIINHSGRSSVRSSK